MASFRAVTPTETSWRRKGTAMAGENDQVVTVCNDCLKGYHEQLSIGRLIASASCYVCGRPTTIETSACVWRSTLRAPMPPGPVSALLQIEYRPWHYEVVEPTTACKHGTEDCEACGTTSRRDAKHSTVGGKGLIGRIK